MDILTIIHHVYARRKTWRIANQRFVYSLVYSPFTIGLFSGISVHLGDIRPISRPIGLLHAPSVYSVYWLIQSIRLIQSARSIGFVLSVERHRQVLTQRAREISPSRRSPDARIPSYGTIRRLHNQARESKQYLFPGVMFPRQ